MISARHSLAAVLIPAALLAVVAACSGTDELPNPCPAGGVLADAERFTVQTENASLPPPADVLFNAQIDTVISQCTPDDDVVIVGFTLAGLAEKNPDSTADTITLPLFVVVIDDNGVVTERQSHDVTVIFGEDIRLVEFSQRIKDITIPLGDDTVIAAYRILAGFQLTPEQLIWNRSRP